MAKQSLHESFSPHEEVKAGDERTFGMVFMLACTLLATWLSHHRCEWSNFFFGAGLFFFLSAMLFPSILKPLNILWFKFGLLLGRIVSPIVLGLLFFIVITPFGIAFRMMGKDPLRLKFDKNAKSYWIKRGNDEPAHVTMKNQF